MYTKLIRPLLFKISPEAIHHIIVRALKVLHYIPGGHAMLAAVCEVRNPILEREVFGLKFPNPVGLAAGFDKNAEVYDELRGFGFGFIEIGTVTPRPQPGNPRPRLFRLPADGALINRMGFNNGGIEKAADNLRRRRGSSVVGANLGKNTLTPNEAAAADYLKVFRALYDHADYFVVNVSCPNIAKLACLQEKDNLAEILGGLVEFRRGQNLYRPILLKISPDLSDEQVDEMVETMKECGLDGIVATNTSTSREGLKSDPDTIKAIGAGGLSGAPLKERSLHIVRRIREKTGGCYPIIGVGGIMTAQDALDMLDAGATLIQVYTGFIYQGPLFMRRICKAIIQKHKAL